MLEVRLGRMARWSHTSLLLLLLLQPAAPSSLLHLRHPPGGEWQRPAQPNVTLAIILPESNTEYPWAWPRIGPAIKRAVRTINADPTLLPHHRLTYIFKSSEDPAGVCSESEASLMAVDLKFAYNPWAFIGPGCSYTSSPVGLFTTHWDIPMVTAGAPAVAFHDGGYPSVTNTGPTHLKLGRFALRICQRFGWRQHVMLIFSDKKRDDRPCYFTVEGLFMELKHTNITLTERVFEEDLARVDYAQILADIRNDGRGEWAGLRGSERVYVDLTSLSIPIPTHPVTFDLQQASGWPRPHLQQ